MAFLLRTTLRTPIALARPAFRYHSVAAVRTFTSAQQFRLKEDKEQDPHELDRVKHEQVKKQERGEGHWHEELASGSETHVKADREKVDNHDEHMEDLQKETASQSEKDHPHGKDEH